MQFTWHLLIIIAAVLLGVVLFQKSEKTPNMSLNQLKEADMYRNYAYLLLGIAVAMAFYYYYINNRQKASMYGGGSMHQYGNMCGKAHMYGKANMCGGGGYKQY